MMLICDGVAAAGGGYSLSRSLALARSLSLSISLSLSHTHSHTHSLSHTHTLSLSRMTCDGVATEGAGLLLHLEDLGRAVQRQDAVLAHLPGSRDHYEAGSYLRLIDSCITQLKAQGPSRTCNVSKEEEGSRPSGATSGCSACTPAVRVQEIVRGPRKAGSACAWIVFPPH